MNFKFDSQFINHDTINICLQINQSIIIDFDILLEYIEVLKTFIDNLDLMINNYGKLDQQFGRTFWCGKYTDYSFDLWNDSKMIITISGKKKLNLNV